MTLGERSLGHKTLDIFTDGACSGNPGPAAIGIVIKSGGETIGTISRPIGEATNNIAEYTALIFALQEALILKAEHVRVFTDSELMYRQIIGQYQVHHVLRGKNKEADDLAKKAIKQEQAKVVASPP